ncbi:MAG: single-stranded DNA-binding protein [Planctomycetia bacterium]|nr:single-stranded DNA-binding protein [Planctomycetia bacterium]
MASVNKVMLLGRLTADPELRYTPKGTAVCDLRMALNRQYTDPGTGEKKEEATFVDVTAWGRTAETSAQYLKKGREVFVEGRLKTDQWEQDGQKRSKLTVTAENVTFIGGGGGSGGGREYGGEGAEGGGGGQRRGGFQRGAPPARGPQRPNAPPPQQEEPPMEEQPPPDMGGDPPF